MKISTGDKKRGEPEICLPQTSEALINSTPRRCFQFPTTTHAGNGVLPPADSTVRTEKLTYPGTRSRDEYSHATVKGVVLVWATSRFEDVCTPLYSYWEGRSRLSAHTRTNKIGT